MHKNILTVIPLIVGTVAGIVLAAWHIPSLYPVTHLYLFDTSMKPITTALFIVSALQIVYTKKIIFAESNKKYRVTVAVLSLGMFVLIAGGFYANLSQSFAAYWGLVPFAEADEGWDFVPQVSSVPTFLCFMLIMYVSIFTAFKPKARKTLIVVGSLQMLIGIVAILGNVINVPLLYYGTSGGWGSGMAVHTGLLFVVIGLYYILLSKNHYV